MRYRVTVAQTVYEDYFVEAFTATEARTIVGYVPGEVPSMPAGDNDDAEVIAVEATGQLGMFD